MYTAQQPIIYLAQRQFRTIAIDSATFGKGPLRCLYTVSTGLRRHAVASRLSRPDLLPREPWAWRVMKHFPGLYRLQFGSPRPPCTLAMPQDTTTRRQRRNGTKSTPQSASFLESSRVRNENSK